MKVGETAKGELRMDVNAHRGYGMKLDLEWSNGQRTQQVWELSQDVKPGDITAADH